MLAGVVQQVLDQGPNWTEIAVAIASVIGVLFTGIMLYLRKRK